MLERVDRKDGVNNMGVSLLLDEPLAWTIAALTIVGPATFFLLFLWFFRVTRLIFVKEISCPETKRRAVVELLAQVGEMAPYRGVRACSVLEGQRGITCGGSCLSSSEVRKAPYIVVQKL